MKCYKCGNEMTITNRMDSSGGMSSYRQTAYCNICKESIDLGTNFASEKKKDSTLSIVAAVLGAIRPLRFIGIIVGIIDLIKGRNDGKRHLGLLLAIIFCIIWGVIGANDSGNGENAVNNQATSEEIGTTAEVADDYVEVEEITTNNATKYVKTGDTFKIDGLDITVKSCNLNFENYEKWQKPDKGMKYIRVRFDCKNNGTEDEYISIYDYDCYADEVLCEQEYIVDDDDFINANLSSGRSKTYDVYFEVPKKSETIELEYTGFSDNKIIIKLK